MISSVRERAHNKAFAKLTTLKHEIFDLESDLIFGRTGGITHDELSSVISRTKTEYEIWNYIMELIEKNQ
tara:strand:+ start:344 stop:553 length:210 start_codon:yes stop_codon:yes gene_type:complete